MQEARGTTVQPRKPAFVVAGVWGWGARTCAWKGRAAGRGRSRRALARAVMLNHEILDAVHRGVEGKIPAAGAGGAPSAERVGAQRPTEATGAGSSCSAAAAAAPSKPSWRTSTSKAQGGRYILSIAAEDLALRMSMSTEEQQESESA